MREITVAATQMAISWDLPANLDKAETLIRQAAKQGANIILIQELFEAPYFCIEQQVKHFDLATSLEENDSIKRFQQLAKELEIVLPFSWFEKANRAFFNSVAMVDADGSILGTYRKTHIPNVNVDLFIHSPFGEFEQEQFSSGQISGSTNISLLHPIQ